MPAETQLESRPANWLPLPGPVLGADATDNTPQVDENDLFVKGEVASFFPNQGKGSVKTKSAEEMPFDLKEISLIGPKGESRYLGVGARVGFDASSTSKGKRITKLKIY